MHNPLEGMVRSVYLRWKSGQARPGQAHPDEEDFACFLEKKLSSRQEHDFKQHVVLCDSCAHRLKLMITAETAEQAQLPADLLERTQALIDEPPALELLELWLFLKNQTLEIIRTTGDVLVGQELVPAALLRSRQISQFKDTVTVLKDFKDIRLEVRIEAKGDDYFDALIVVKEKKTQAALKDLRITLLRAGTELESYVTDTGKVSFEHVELGTYAVEISALHEKLASVVIDMKR